MLLFPLAAGEEERWAAPALGPLQVGKKIDLSSVLSSFSETHLRLSSHRDRECCIFALSSWLMWEMLSEMKENHQHAALMRSIFQHTMSLHFVGMTCGVSSHARHTLRDARTHTRLKTENLIDNPLKWQKQLFLSCHPLSLPNNDTQLKKQKIKKQWILILLNMSFSYTMMEGFSPLIWGTREWITKKTHL